MKISIITAVYNRQNCIADCIRSVLEQDYEDVEYIVIDGGSTDGTQQKIKPYEEQLDYYISESDGGVYDALNKGINQATGDIIGVLHSDDLFNSSQTLTEIGNTFRSIQADLVYAKGYYVDSKNTSKIRRVYPSRPFQKKFLRFGWIPLHTTIFIRREIFLMYGMYDTRFSIASDYEISLRWFQNDEIRKYYLDQWVVKMKLGGLSTHAGLQLKKSIEDLKIIRLYRLDGFLTLACKIGRKVPQYLLPRVRKRIDNSRYVLQQ